MNTRSTLIFRKTPCLPQIAACLWCIHLVVLVAVYDQAGHVTRHCSGAPLLLPVLAHHRSSLYRDTQHPHNISTARADTWRLRPGAELRHVRALRSQRVRRGRRRGRVRRGEAALDALTARHARAGGCSEAGVERGQVTRGRGGMKTVCHYIAIEL